MGSNELPHKEVCLEDWVRGNYVWCFVILVISMGLGGAKSWGEVLESLYGVASYKRGWVIFMGLVDPSRHNVNNNNPNFTQLFETNYQMFLNDNKFNTFIPIKLFN